MSNTINFTKAALKALPLPNSGRDYYKDTKEKGLSLAITKAGTITFFVRKRVQGKDERITIGTFPEFSIENARKQAMKVKADIATGIDPSFEKKRLKADILFGDMFAEYLEKYAKLHKQSWQYDERIITRLAGHLFKRKASQITRTDWMQLHEEVGKNNGEYSANRLITLVCVVYNKAIDWDWAGTNPASRIKKFKEKSRERFLRKDEVAGFFQALALEENETARDYIMASLLTGARKTNVLEMRWDQVNFNLKEWRIPKTKNGEMQTVPLSDTLIALLEKRREISESEFVFEGTGATGHLADPRKAWGRVLKRAGIEDLRLHDLRRTLGSWMAANGVTTAIIGKTLAHKSVQATKVYERLDIDPVRESMMVAEKALFEVGGVN